MYAKVLPIRGFFMSATHLHHSDKKYVGWGYFIYGKK